MSILLGTCGTGRFTFNSTFSVTVREPMPYNKKVVVSRNIGGYPEVTEYFDGDTLVFYTVQTWSGSTEDTWEIYQP